MCINYTEKTPKVHYLTLNHFKSSLQEQWFKAQAVGVNSLKSILKDMYEAGGGGGFTQETNFPWRKMLKQKLQDNNAPTRATDGKHFKYYVKHSVDKS